jgi:hypothetical protein
MPIPQRQANHPDNPSAKKSIDMLKTDDHIQQL